MQLHRGAIGPIRIGRGETSAEVGRVPVEHDGSSVAMIPSPLGIASIELADGSMLQRVVCDAVAVAEAEDLGHFGRRRAYRAAQR